MWQGRETEGVILDRVLLDGTPSSRGRRAKVQFSEGTDIYHHWQLTKLESAAVAGATLAPAPIMASETASAPATCRPPQRMPWKDDRKIAAIYLNKDPSGLYNLSLLVNGSEGTPGRVVARLQDLPKAEVSSNLELLCSRVRGLL